MEKRIRARVRDLAPFASAEEDLSDERESSPSANHDDDNDDIPNRTLVNIVEEKPENETHATSKMKAILSTTTAKTAAATSTTAIEPASVAATATPRIDISRASSSSYQEDSSPERELILGQSKGVKLETAFGEEMASDLHSSTEELSFHQDAIEEDEDEEKKRRKRKSSSRTTTPFSDICGETAMRKDSTCSVGGGGNISGVDIALLSIGGSGLGFCGGRTSRVSSVGSVASGGSVGSNVSVTSHGSALSHLSATSNLSRGSSPHRMSLETSFCGPKPVLNSSGVDGDIVDESTAAAAKNVVSAMTTRTTTTTTTTTTTPPPPPPIIVIAASAGLVNDEPNTHEKKGSRKPTEIRDGRKSDSRHAKTKHHKRKKPVVGNPKTQKFISLYSDDDDEDEHCGEPTPAKVAPDNSRSNLGASAVPTIDPSTQKFIPLKDYDDDGNEAGRSQTKNKREYVVPDDAIPENRSPRAQSPHRSQENDGLTRWGSEKRAKPFTNKTLINFISKYDVSRYSNADSGASGQEGDYQGVGKINEEFQTFISLKDEDDRERPAASDRSSKKFVNSENTVTKDEYAAPKEGRKKHFHATSTLIQVHKDKSETAMRGREDDNVVETFSVVDTGHKFNLVVEDDVHENSNTSGCKRNDEDDRHGRSRSHDVDYSPERNHHGRSHHSRSHSHSLSHSHGRSHNSCSRKRSPTRHDKKSNENVTSQAEFRTNHTVERPEQPNPHSTSEREMQLGLENAISGETYNGVLSYDSQLNLTKRKGNANVVHGSKGLQRSDDIRNESMNQDCTGYKCPTDAVQRSEWSSTMVQHESSQHCDPHMLRSFRSELKDETKSRTSHEPADPNQMRRNEIENYCPALTAEHKPPVEEPETVEEKMEQDKQKLLETDTSIDADTTALLATAGLTTTPENEEEHKNLVNREESFEELPYVPTTLPLERPVAAPIVPVKQRATKIEIHPVERPHSHSSTSSQSTTFELQLPADAAALISSCTNVKTRTTTTFTTDTTTTITNPIMTTTQNQKSDTGSDSIKKLHITLPWTGTAATGSTEYAPYADRRRRSSCSKPKRKIGAYNEDKFSDSGSGETRGSSPPPPLPPRRSNSWILFDDVRHESRQSPKRITTLPPPSSQIPSSPMAFSSLPPQLPSTSISFASSCHLTRVPGVDVEARSSANRIVTVAPAKDIIFVTANECSCECHEPLPPPPPMRDSFHGQSL